MLDESQLRLLVGHDVADRDGKPIGYLDTIFEDRDTGRPEWIGVLTGVIRHHHVLVPVQGAEQTNGTLKVPWPKDVVTGAPTYDKEDHRGGILGMGGYRLAISDDKERQAYAHYGLEPEGS